MSLSRSWVVALLRRVIADLEVFQDGRNIPEGTLDSFVVALELACRELAVLGATTQLTCAHRAACTIVQATLTELRETQELIRRSHDHESSPAVIHSGLPGRPSYNIPADNLVFLLENRFTVPQIASVMGVSVRTVRRRMSDIDVFVRQQYSDITDQDLDHLIAQIQHQFPSCGNQQMLGHLQSRGFRIQQIRVRNSQRRVDPEGSLLRHLNGIVRREYSVPAPRSLYHIDGNHKLIRYCYYLFIIINYIIAIVVVGCIVIYI